VSLANHDVGEGGGRGSLVNRRGIEVLEEVQNDEKRLVHRIEVRTNTIG
jgi:hypothetical protein